MVELGVMFQYAKIALKVSLGNMIHDYYVNKLMQQAMTSVILTIMIHSAIKRLAGQPFRFYIRNFLMKLNGFIL